VRVVAALISHPSLPRHFLVQQRPAGKSRGLLWEFPGGKVEQHETDQAALARECEEELGVVLEVGKYLWEGKHAYPDLTVELVLYEAWIRGGEPHPRGGQQLLWANPAQMQALPFCEADVPLIELLHRGAL
jgi:8-oxo-dGTP diphosphatase